MIQTQLGKTVLIIASGLLLASCGRMTPLEPKQGKSMPVIPQGSEVAPTTDELLQSEPQAAPNRNTELRYRSEEREDDPFDLPPPE